MKTVLIGGGTGFIGSTLSRLLKNNGYDVIVVSRSPGKKRITWADVASNGIPEGTEAVVNVAGQNVLDPTRAWSTNFQKAVRDSRINTTLSLVQAMENCTKKPKVFVSISGVGIYKPSEEIVYDEHFPVERHDFISCLAREWENCAKPAYTMRTVTVRSGVVLGRTGGMVKQIIFPFYCGLGGPLGNGKQYFPWIHVHDLCRLLLFSIENSNVNGILNGVAPQIVTNKEFTAAFAKALHRPAFFPIPEFFIHLLFGPDRAPMMLKGQKVVPKRVTEEYGFRYLYPDIDEACQECAVLNYTMPDIK